ncbi:hypothetical protein PFISCL1PPCAC_1072, partial [Pristionchus fissidentatus]
RPGHATAFALARHSAMKSAAQGCAHGQGEPAAPAIKRDCWLLENSNASQSQRLLPNDQLPSYEFDEF